MPRTPDVQYYASRGAYFTCFKGKQHKLAVGPKDAPTGPTFLAALKAFRALMEDAAAPTAGNDNRVRTVLDMYAQFLEKQGRKRSLSMFLATAKHAVAAFGEKRVGELIPHDVTTWLDGMERPRTVAVGPARKGGKRTLRTVAWGETTRTMAANHLRAALNWARKQGLIRSHCLSERGSLTTGPGRSRGHEALIPAADMPCVLAAAPSSARPLLAVLAGTGCRPGEARNAEAHNYSAADAALVYRWNTTRGHVHKTARKTRRDRVVFLPPDVALAVAHLASERPDGPLFRTERGNRWSNACLARMLIDVRKRLKLPYVLTAYSFRHTFATRFLERGGSVKLLADCLGTSVRMIEQHYGHLAADRAGMRSALFNVMGQDRG